MVFGMSVGVRRPPDKQHSTSVSFSGSVGTARARGKYGICLGLVAGVWAPALLAINYTSILLGRLGRPPEIE